MPEIKCPDKENESFNIPNSFLGARVENYIIIYFPFSLLNKLFPFMQETILFVFVSECIYFLENICVVLSPNYNK